MRKATKIIISIAVVLIAGLNLIVQAFAQDPFTSIAVGGLTGASGAGLFGSMAGMSGIDIGWSQSTGDPMDAMWNVLNPDHVYFSGEKHEASGVGVDVYDYIQVDIGDWLDAQSSFIERFVRENSVTDNSSGTTSTLTYYNGLPLVNNTTGPVYVFNSGNGEVASITVAGHSIGVTNHRAFCDNDSFIQVPDNTVLNFQFKSDQSGNISCWICIGTTNNPLYNWSKSGFIGVKSTSTGVNWTSETVDIDVFDNWGTAKVSIPHDMSQLQTGWTLSDFLNELDRIWSGAGEDNIIIEDGSQPVPPTPVPIPDTPLGDVPFDDWVDLWGQGIYQQLENQSDALDLIGSNGLDAIEELESIDTNTEDLVEVAESIDTNIGVGNGILGGIRSLAQSAVNYLEGIAEHVAELVEEIVEGTETLIAGILNQIPQAFGVIFGPIKQASSIWHYVVEWIQSIGAPFQFIWSMASGTSYYVILPVYASLAAAVVLAFFKRFGR